MEDPPEVDGRRGDDIREHVQGLAPYYVPEWDPDGGGVGASLVELFAEMAADVTARLDAAPAKHRIAFFDALGFDARPPRPARAPVQFELDENAPRNVRVRPGTEAIAEADDEVVFRVAEGDGFEATPARLTDVVAVDPAADALYDLSDVVEGGENTLFDGENVQEHVWYVGDEELLTVGADTTVTVVVETEAEPDVLLEHLVWEYYGEVSRSGEIEEGWHEFEAPVSNAGVGDGCVAVDVSPNGTLVEHEVDGLESKWLRVRLPSEHDPRGRYSFRVTAVRLGPAPEPLYFDDLLANDVPLATGADAETVPVVTPFGEMPREGDTFYLASVDALTKSGSEATITFGSESTILTGREQPGDDDRGAAIQEAFGDRPGRHGPAADVVHHQVTRDVESGVSAGETREGDRDSTTEEMASKTATATGTTDAATLADHIAAETGQRGETAADVASDRDLTENEADDDGGDGDRKDGEGSPGEPNGPTVSWEYWNGGGWARIPGLSDGTQAFTADGDVSFTVPVDLEPTNVAGHEGHWIRARLVGGDYGEVVHVEEDENRWTRQVNVSPPIYDRVTVRYDFDAAEIPDHVLAYNALAYERAALADGESFRPYRALPDESQTLYLGFDRPLVGGPIQLLVDVEDRAFPPWFAPRVRWERATNADGDGWKRVPATDETDGLTDRGIVGLSFEESPIGSDRFGANRHWIRARVRGTPFDVDAAERAGAAADGGTGRDGTLVEDAADVSERSDCDAIALDPERWAPEPQPCGTAVETVPSGGGPSTVSPTLLGIYPNAGWARNAQTVEGELLGGSDGGRHQTFAVDETPVVEPVVWVNELGALSAAQRSTLQTARPADVLAEPGSNGDLQAFWVRWVRVHAFVDSGRNDRHYVLDPTAGRIEFGDGRRGKIPPRGRDNVRIDYATGGGNEGNVPTGAVEELKSGLPFVEAVTNPIPATGGVPAEEIEGVLERAPRTLRDRDRAVAAADFERLAEEASRRIDRARCIPGMDMAGDAAPGWVTILVVPDDGSDVPDPSTGLLAEVEDTLSAHAPASLLARGRLVVRGPSAVSVGVDAEIVATADESLGSVEERVEDALEAFLHPLAGGEDGNGWDFGELPSRSDVFALLEGIAGVDHVSSLTLAFEGEELVTTAEGDGVPTTAPDALIHGTDHDITLTHEARAGEC